MGYGTVGGIFFGAPLGANLKSLIWYSPKYFKQYGYTVPTTWDDMIKLSDKMAADGRQAVVRRHRVRYGDRLAADRLDGRGHAAQVRPDVYDQWSAHKIPFNDPKVRTSSRPSAASSRTRSTSTRASVTSSRSRRPRSRRAACRSRPASACLHAQANFYAANWDKGTTVSPTGDVYAFYEPTMSDKFGKVGRGRRRVRRRVRGPSRGRGRAAVPRERRVGDSEGDAERHEAHLRVGDGEQAVDASVFKDPIDKLSVQRPDRPEVDGSFRCFGTARRTRHSCFPSTSRPTPSTRAPAACRRWPRSSPR